MASGELSERAAQLCRDSVIIDMVLPYEFEIGNDVRLFPRWANSGFSFLSVHPAGDRHTVGEAVRRIARCRNDILSRSDCYVLVETVDDIHRARAAGKLGVGLHLEGSRLLERDLNMVEVYYQLGVRFCHPVFNQQQEFGGGSGDPVDGGLTRWGRRVVQEMNRVGMLLDGAHVGYRTTMDIMEMTTLPFIFSHNGLCGVYDHFRNVEDDQLRACAKTGGVVGVSGANNYLGDEPTNETLFRHIDYVVQRVGPDHVGIGFDYVDATELLNAFVKSRPDEWPGSWRPWKFATPEQVPSLVDFLLNRGYSDSTIKKLLGENWLRVAAAWK